MEELIKLVHRVVCACCCFLLFGVLVGQAQEPAKPPEGKPVTSSSGSAPDKTATEPSSQKIIQQGIAIEFTIDPVKEKSTLTAGEDALVKFKVNDTTTGTPVKGLGLSVWMSLRDGDKAL